MTRSVVLAVPTGNRGLETGNDFPLELVLGSLAVRQNPFQLPYPLPDRIEASGLSHALIEADSAEVAHLACVRSAPCLGNQVDLLVVESLGVGSQRGQFAFDLQCRSVVGKDGVALELMDSDRKTSRSVSKRCRSTKSSDSISRRSS